jgi:hypothetical protein
MISEVPKFEQELDISLNPNQEVLIHNLDRVRLGGDEPAICAGIELAPGFNTVDGLDDVKLALLDVGFRVQSDGRFGPYDLTGNGEKKSFTSDYVLVRKVDTNEGPQTLYYELPKTGDIELGRFSDAAKALEYFKGAGQHVSAKHAVLRITDNKVSIMDEGSKNGTVLKDLNVLDAEASGSYGFGYTVSIGENISRVGNGRHYNSPDQESGWGHGTYAGRPIIARDTPINGGVYPVGHSRGEALVIDDQKYPDELNKVYDTLIQDIHAGNPKNLMLRGIKRALINKPTERNTEILKYVFNNVYDVLRYDIVATESLAINSQKIALNNYIHEGVGVCRTQAVLSAYLVERLVKDGYLDGRISIDRNERHKIDGDSGGHAWARFTDKDGKVFIIDPAQRYVGSLDDSRKIQANWDYRRTEDMVNELLR